MTNALPESGLEDFCRGLAPVISEYKYILLKGELGAGKTTFVRYISAALGLDAKDVASPTFSVINSYRAGGKTLIHSDLYRLESMVELENTGFFELAEDADWVFVEWAERFALKDVLETYIEINIIKAGESRVYQVEYKR